MAAAAAAAAAALKVTFPGMPDVTARLFLYTGVSQGTKLQNDIKSGKAEQHLIPEVSRRDHLAVAFLDARRVVGITKQLSLVISRRLGVFAFPHMMPEVTIGA